MRIAVLTSHTPSLLRFRLDMMLAFINRGHQVIAVGNQDEEEWAPTFAEHGIRYRKVRLSRNSTNPLKDIATLLDLRRVLKEERPDKIFSYQAKTVIYGTIAANQLGIRENYPLIAGVGSVFMNNSVKGRLMRSLLSAEYQYAIRHCPAVFFQNQDDVETFRSMRILKKQKVVMLRGSGVNLDHFQVQLLPEQFGILCVARLIRDKGIIEYLEACKKIKQRHPDVKCMLVGEIDTNPTAISEEELNTYVEQGIVSYYGEQSDVRPYFQQCSVFILPSYREGTPKAVLEAMASGRAVITTDAPGCRGTVEDGVNGFLVPVGEVDPIAERVEQLLQSPERLAEMAVYGRKMAEEEFDVCKVNRCISDVMGL